MSTILLHMRWA